MAQPPLDQLHEHTWTPYPSLLATLPLEEHRRAFENAARAHSCGRYQDGQTIFDSDLPESSTIPILALQRADMLTTQGHEKERIKLLQAALEVTSTTESSIRLLMELMLADARFWALGEMQPAIDLIPKVRKLLRSSGMENLSDVYVSSLSSRCALQPTER
jgi:hypothetical protein